MVFVWREHQIKGQCKKRHACRAAGGQARRLLRCRPPGALSTRKRLRAATSGTLIAAQAVRPAVRLGGDTDGETVQARAEHGGGICLPARRGMQPQERAIGNGRRQHPAGCWCSVHPAGRWCAVHPAGRWCVVGPAGCWCAVKPVAGARCGVVHPAGCWCTVPIVGAARPSPGLPWPPTSHHACAEVRGWAGIAAQGAGGPPSAGLETPMAQYRVHLHPGALGLRAFVYSIVYSIVYSTWPS
jgi:hypothetical protein